MLSRTVSSLVQFPQEEEACLACIPFHSRSSEVKDQSSTEWKMPRSEEAEWWANAVYAAIQEIPYGKVTSYGHIALLLGERMYPPGPS
jgi:hypothetical protein